MQNPNAQEVVTALRRRIEAKDHNPGQQQAALTVLESSIEKLLFQRGLLGPVDAILERAAQSLTAAQDWAAITDEQLLQLWNGNVDKHVLEFSRNPESWVDRRSMEFRRRSAVVFGVEDTAIHQLMRNFHQLPKAARVAIFVPIRRSSIFSYIEREIKEMVDDLEIADPTESLRALIHSIDVPE